MGRKRKLARILLSAIMASAIGAGVLGSVPLPAEAAEVEEAYTVNFEPYEGTCGTESVTVPKGESITLPDASYEGHYLESWIEVAVNGDVHTFLSVGAAGKEYTPERSLNLYANWKPVQEQADTVVYEARIGDKSYEELEEAFADAQAGDTITVLKDCSISSTLEAVADSITLQSEDAENPAVISRDGEFTGKNYHRTDLDDVLLGIEGSLTIRNIILDGGAELDDDFNNAGQAWGGPLVYVAGACTVEGGTVLQNNYNTDFDGDNRTARTAGAIHVEWGGEFTMTGGLIQRCYTNGAGGGIQTGRTSHAAIVSGTIRECYAMVGGAVDFFGSANASGMAISGNKAFAAIVAVHGEVTLSDCLIENSEVTGDSGTIGISENHPVVIEGCTITGSHNKYTSAIGFSGKDRTEPLTIRDCTIRGNTAEHPYSGTTINYMTKADLILDGKIVMEDNTVADGKAWDIRFYYQDATPVTLGTDFESDSTFVMWGRDFTPGALLVDASSNGKEADASQFLWKTDDYRTEEKDGNIYLAEVPETYFIGYDANNKDTGLTKSYIDPNPYTSKDTVVILDKDGIYPYMGTLEKAGCDFAGWNTKKDGTGTDYAGGEEIHLTENTCLYAKWEAKKPVIINFIYNDGKIGTDSTKAVPGLELTFPDASRKGYDFMGWYVAEDGTVSLAFTHASDYVIALDGDGEEESGNAAEPEQPDTPDKDGTESAGENPQAGQAWRPWWFIVAGALVVIMGIGVFFVVKKKQEDD